MLLYVVTSHHLRIVNVQCSYLATHLTYLAWLSPFEGWLVVNNYRYRIDVTPHHLTYLAWPLILRRDNGLCQSCRCVKISPWRKITSPENKGLFKNDTVRFCSCWDQLAVVKIVFLYSIRGCWDRSKESSCKSDESSGAFKRCNFAEQAHTDRSQS